MKKIDFLLCLGLLFSMLTIPAAAEEPSIVASGGLFLAIKNGHSADGCLTYQDVPSGSTIPLQIAFFQNIISGSGVFLERLILQEDTGNGFKTIAVIEVNSRISYFYKEVNVTMPAVPTLLRIVAIYKSLPLNWENLKANNNFYSAHIQVYPYGPIPF